MNKVQENFRIAFFKDVILHRILDEVPYGILSDIEQLNYAEIFNALHEDNSFIKNLFRKMKSLAKEERLNALKFMGQYFVLGKSLQEVQAVACFSSFYEKTVIKYKGTVADGSELTENEYKSRENVFSVLQSVLSTGKQITQEEIFSCGEIIKLCVEQDALCLRQFVIEQVPPPPPCFSPQWLMKPLNV